MSRLILEFPEGLTDALRIPPSEQEDRLKRELAIRLYEKGFLSLGKARELAEMSRWEFIELLGREGIDLSYDEAELERDLNNLERLF